MNNELSWSGDQQRSAQKGNNIVIKRLRRKISPARNLFFQLIQSSRNFFWNRVFFVTCFYKCDPVDRRDLVGKKSQSFKVGNNCNQQLLLLLNWLVGIPVNLTHLYINSKLLLQTVFFHQPCWNFYSSGTRFT